MIASLVVNGFLWICPLWPGLYGLLYYMYALTFWCIFTLLFLYTVLSIIYLFLIAEEINLQDVAKAIRRPCPRDLAMLGDFSLVPFPLHHVT